MHKVTGCCDGPISRIRIGKLSHLTGCNIETIRYYERIGLLPHPPRSGSRYRLYNADDVRRLVFVRRARDLGFSLDQVRALLALSADPRGNTCDEVRQVAADHLADVRAKIADLRTLERALADAVRRCDAGGPSQCPLIDALSSNVSLLLVSGDNGESRSPA